MATIHRETRVRAPAEKVWDAARDVGALHTRLVPGFVVGTRLLEGNVREVTFGNGLVVKEPIVSVDDERRRLAWTAVGGATTHYNAVLQVTPDGEGCRVSWTTDLLPDGMAVAIGGMMDRAMAALRATLEGER